MKAQKLTLLRALQVLVILAMAFSGFGGASALDGDPLGTVTIAPGDPVHIAYALVTSGPNASLGIDELNGIEIAIDDSGGKILGHDILLTGEDEGCSPEGGSAAGAALASDASIVAVIGTSCSGAARTAMPLLFEAGFAMVSPSNTGFDLTEPGNPNNYPGYLRVSWNDNAAAALAAYYARDYLEFSTAATITDGSPPSHGLQQAFAKEFTELGGVITAQESIDPGQTDMSAELAAIAAGSPQMLYFPVFMPEGGYVINQARATAGLEGVHLMGSEALWNEDIVNATGENIEGFTVTGWDSSKNSPQYADHFLPAYEAKFGIAPISMFHAHAYDAFMMIKAAIQAVAVVDGDGTLHIGRQALRDALYGTTAFPGLTGELTCSPTGDCAALHLAVYQYHYGQSSPEYLWPRNLEFAGSLGEGWYWVNENPARWNLTEDPGFLRILASPYGTGGENLLLRPVVQGDFVIKTRLLFEPNSNYQFAGLVIWQDQENFLQFGRAFCDIEGSCVGNGLYFDKALGGNSTDSNFATSIGNPSDVYLRLERRGDMVRAFYSLDEGISWYEIGTHSIPSDFQVNAVGLTASQNFFTPESDIPADFDFFELTEGWGFLPEGFHDYDQGDVPSWACNAGGWAADPDNRAARVNIDVIVDDASTVSLVADAFRQDLLDAGVCEGGNCSFSTSLWGLISSYQAHKVDIWAQDDTGDWVLLSNSAKPLTCRTYDIYAYNPTTGVTQQITNMRDADEYNPAWSPDGKKMAINVVLSDGSFGSYITTVATGVSAPLKGAQDGGNDATWSPSGSVIVFDRRWMGDPSLYRVPPTGGNRKLLRRDAESASFSPNGRYLTFNQPSDGSIRTVAFAMPGGRARFIDYGGYPAWSPDGKWIAYQKDGDIWKVQVDQTGAALGGPIQLTRGPYSDERATWSRDGQSIIYHSGMTRDYDLWSVPAAGGDPTWLTGAIEFGDYDPATNKSTPDVAYASFSPNGQAARLWVSPYTFDLPGGYWTEGTHSYHFEATWAGGSEITDDGLFNVLNEAPVYDGFALLRPLAVRAGPECPAVDSIRPDQPTRFLNGSVTNNPMTYQEAVAYFAGLSAQAVWDVTDSAALVPNEILPFSLDHVDSWFQYVCSYTSP